MRYERSLLRKLLEDLTDPEFSKSLDNFPSVRDQFSDNQQKYLKVDIILNHFEKHQNEDDKEGFPKFLEVIENCNYTAYKNYAEQLEVGKKAEILSLDNLQKEVRNSTIVEALQAILPQEDELFKQSVKQAYQDFILQLANDDDSNYEPEDLDDILWMLKDFNEEVLILRFIPRLIACISIKNKTKYQATVDKIKKVARDNLPKYGINQSAFTKELNDFKQEYQESSNKSYLIVAIKDNNSYPNTFQISGWLATDNPELDLIQLDNPNSGLNYEQHQGTEKLYDLEQIKKILVEYRLQINCIREVNKLIIEFFLPDSLLCLDVDKWTANPHQFLLESLYEVRIRSLDRLKLEYRDRNKIWKEKWMAVQKCRNPLHRFSSSHSNCNTDTLVRRLQDKKCVGLKLSSVLKSDHKGVASALYYTGTPIALWFRCEPPEGDCETQLNQLLQAQLLQLSERVFKKRCQQECHISLLWDDPNRLIPHYQLQ